jgi:hypothetical protein
VGLDYRYLLHFERDARVDVLERLAGMAAPTADGPATIVLPDRTVELPFGTWGEPQRRIAWDDTRESWLFSTVLRFAPDEPIEDYLRHLDGAGELNPDRYDERGRLDVGFIDLAVYDETGTTGEDLVCFVFGTPGTSMSIAFMESDSIRSAMVDLLESCRGVYGVLDMEDFADLIWLRGERRDDRLPTAEMSLAEIESLVGAAAAPPALAGSGPIPVSFAAEQLFAEARHVRRSAGGSVLGVHHWLVAVHADDDVRTAASRQALASGDSGAPLSEDDVRTRAIQHAREQARTIVSAQDIAVVVDEAARAG